MPQRQFGADHLQALFIGFTYFKADNSQQGTQNQLLGVFMVWYPGFLLSIAYS